MQPVMIDKHNVEAVYPSSPMQQGMLFHSLHAPESGYYILQWRCVLTGELDVATFARTWEKLMHRHTALRTAFSLGESLAQVVPRHVPVPLVTQDWSDVPQEEHEDRMKSYLMRDRQQGFDLSEAPLMRLHLIRTGTRSHYFVWTFHHVLLDGWSNVLLLQELRSYYAAYSKGEDLSLPAPRPYGDYISWLQRQDVTQAEVFWRRMLKGFESTTTLPCGTVKASDTDAHLRSERIRVLSSSETAALHAAARTNQLTLNSIMQGVWGLLLASHSGNRDVVFGATVSGRPTSLRDSASMIGLFINTLPIRVRIDPGDQLLALLRRLQQQQADAQEYAYTPLVDIQGWSDMPRGKPLFECTLAFENYRLDPDDRNQQPAQISAPDTSLSLRVSDIRVDHKLSYPLALIVGPVGDLALKIVYDAGRYAPSDIDRLLEQIVLILRTVSSDSTCLISDVPLLSEKERRQVVEEFNNAPAALSQQLCIHHLFERQVNLSPDSIALVFEDHQLSYEGLNMAANRLARHLIALGVSTEVCVALCLQRGIEMVLALLAVLKAGGTYVPMGKDEPTHRLGQMLDGCGAVVLLTQQELTASLPVSWAMVVSIDADQEQWSQESGQDLGVELDDRCLAYQIYTSGSSGNPKAVGVEHRQVVNYVAGVSERMGLESRWRMCLMTTIAADLGYTMLYPSLCCGGELHVVSEEVGTDSRKWERYSSERRIEVVKLTPTHMQGLMRGKQAIPQRVMVIGGEVCRREWVERVKQEGERCEVYNHYGPTECTVGVVMRRVEGEQEEERIAIGRPLRGSRAYVMDWRGEVAGVSMRGELGIGGGGLSRGYMRDAEKTAERFVPDGVSGRAGERLYRTGDSARWGAEGELHYEGRRDQQVKVRGYRIELGEIESVMSECAGVEACAVKVWEDERGNKRLVGYVVRRGEERLDQEEIKEQLRRRLPEHMVPVKYVEMRQMPMTSNGKLDRGRLPKQEEQEREGKEEEKTAIEEIVSGIWGEVLGVKKIGIHENFFELGGHSLLATQVVSRVREVMGVEIELKEVFERPTVRGMAEAVEAEGKAGANQQIETLTALARQNEAAGNQREGEGKSTSLPFGKQIGKIESFSPASLDFSTAIDPLLLAQTASRLGLSDETFLLACWFILLLRLSADDRVTVGFAYSGRGFQELELSIGLYAKYLPISLSLSAQQPISSLLEQLAHRLHEIQGWEDVYGWHRESPSEGAGREVEYLPVLFDYQSQSQTYQHDQLSMAALSAFACIERFEVKLRCGGGGSEAVMLGLDYNQMTYKAEEMELLIRRMEQVVRAVLLDQARMIEELEVISEQERRMVIEEFNRSSREYETTPSIAEMIGRQAAIGPDRVAVIYKDQHLSYAEMNRRAAIVARRLRREGVGREGLVVLRAERSLEAVIGLVGVWKAGGAYVPVEATHPVERMRHVLEETEAKVVIDVRGGKQ